MAAPIGVEAQRQAMSAKHFLKPTKRRGRAFFRHQQRRLDRARRVIHGHDEIERRPTAQPFVSQRVLMRYHSGRGRRGRLRRCAPRRFAFYSRPFAESRSVRSIKYTWFIASSKMKSWSGGGNNAPMRAHSNRKRRRVGCKATHGSHSWIDGRTPNKLIPCWADLFNLTPKMSTAPSFTAVRIGTIAIRFSHSPDSEINQPARRATSGISY
jgi:hypothetical protein